MDAASHKKVRVSGSLTGASGVHFVVGELSRLGFIALPTVKNTKGIDIIASTQDFKRTIYLQAKTNKDKYDFWIVGNPVQGDSIFYVFVNLLSNQKNARPEYYVVPSKDVYAKFARFENANQQQSPTEAISEDILKRIKNGETAWGILWETGISVRAIREIAKNNKLKIKYDRGKGEDFPFCFFIKKKDETTYRDNWKLLLSTNSPIQA